MKTSIRKIVSIVGARPQFIKLAPLARLFNDSKKVLNHFIIHTGQHYSYNMSAIFFDNLKIPEPKYHLGVGSFSHGKQIGLMLKECENVLIKEKPDLAIVYGDTNSTLAGALAARKRNIPVAHVEAGLRSYNPAMPEELNRILTDHCSTLLFCPTETAVKNLKREGFVKIIGATALRVPGSAYHCRPLIVNVGDIMYDSLLLCLNLAEKKSAVLDILNLQPQNYYLATIHRAENTDDFTRLQNLFEALAEVGREKPVVFPIHPRTRKLLAHVTSKRSIPYLKIIDPVSYFDMLILEKNAEKILTDSGGVQKEAFLLKVPCITLRNETEWVETLQYRWNLLVGTDKKTIISALKCKPQRKNSINVFGKGRAGEKIVDVIKKFLAHENNRI